VIVALAGGVGGGRMAAGLAAVLPPRGLTIVVNTGDDFGHLGLHISPDLDSVLYALAGVDNRETGWGRAGETWNFMEALRRLGGETWFRLGDRDLAVHVRRTHLMARGVPLSAVTRMLADELGLRHAVVPMSETPVRTRVRTHRGVLAFQDYFVKLECRPRVRGFRFQGSRVARVPRTLQRLLRPGRVRAVVICPSNPYVSVAPILSVPAIGAWLESRSFPVVGVSPIVGGATVKGPAAKIMRELGAEPSALGVARHYGGQVDGWVIDRRDAGLARAIAQEGKAVLVTDTIMSDREKGAALGRRVVAFALSLTEKQN
jgi:LPPG:FO 2-phospho-L-lactate transferase